MIKNLTLTKCQNTQVEKLDNRGVIGEERERTLIGDEFISDPKINFLDEPTTGFDYYNPCELIKLLHRLAGVVN